MDPRTVQYYDDNAEEIFALYEGSKSGPEKYFKLAFPPGAEILDIGAGSGRDMGILMREAYEAYGAEPSPRLRALATERIHGLAGRIYAGSLPGLAAVINRKFDGILCAAVFQHIPQEQQFDAAFDIRNLLKPNGRLLLSFPKDRPGIDASCRDDRGRLYTPLISAAIELLFERLGFQRIGKWETADRRPARSPSRLRGTQRPPCHSAARRAPSSCARSPGMARRAPPELNKGISSAIAEFLSAFFSPAK